MSSTMIPSTTIPPMTGAGYNVVFVLIGGGDWVDLILQHFLIGVSFVSF